MIPIFTRHKEYKRLKKAANLFKLYWRRKLSRRSLSQHVKREHKRHLDNARRLEQELRDNWETRYRGQERVILALPSLTTKTYQKWQYGNIKAYQDNQIGRLLELNDPNVVMIYILSIEDQDQLIHLNRVTGIKFVDFHFLHTLNFSFLRMFLFHSRAPGSGKTLFCET